MIASKLKFDIYAKSFPINTVFVTDGRDDKVNKIFEKLVKDGLPNFVFIHFSNPDRTGHKEGWTTALNSSYMKQVEILNGYLKKILDEIKSRKYLKNSTVVIVTTDHGGEGSDHSDHTKSVNYTIPFIIWGKAVAKGEDLYKINSDRRIDPLDQRISYDQPGQPIRNGDAANLAVSLLGFSSIEGSTIGFDKPLKINKDQN
jgi:phosphopentomutase